MNLLVNQLKLALTELVRTRDLKGARVDHKVNRRGDLVLAIILPPSRPGEWTEM